MDNKRLKELAGISEADNTNWGDSTWVKKNIQEVIQKNKNAAFSMRMKISGDDGETKWVNVSVEMLEKFIKVL